MDIFCSVGIEEDYYALSLDLHMSLYIETRLTK